MVPADARVARRAARHRDRGHDDRPLDHGGGRSRDRGIHRPFLFWATGVGTLDQIFSGFAGETPWFLLGALLIGSMAGKSGLAQRIAYGVTTRTGNSYSRLLLGFIIVDFLLTFVVPRASRA